MAITPGGRVGDASSLARPGYKGKRKLSDYEREVAHALMRKGHSKRRAIAMARGIIRNAAVAGRWGRGRVRNPAVRAGAVASIAQRKAYSMTDKGLALALVEAKNRSIDLGEGGARWKHGTPEEKAKVRAAVARKYPTLPSSKKKKKRKKRDMTDVRKLAISLAEASRRGLTIDLVGPKGYVHGWHFVGVPAGGIAVRAARGRHSKSRRGIVRDPSVTRTKSTTPKRASTAPIRGKFQDSSGQNYTVQKRYHPQGKYQESSGRRYNVEKVREPKLAPAHETPKTMAGLTAAGHKFKGDPVTYSNGDREVIIHGNHPGLGKVTSYSDGRHETTVKLDRLGSSSRPSSATHTVKKRGENYHVIMTENGKSTTVAKYKTPHEANAHAARLRGARGGPMPTGATLQGRTPESAGSIKKMQAARDSAMRTPGQRERDGLRQASANHAQMNASRADKAASASKLAGRPPDGARYQVIDAPDGGYEVIDTHGGNRVMSKHDGRNGAYAAARERNNSPEPRAGARGTPMPNGTSLPARAPAAPTNPSDYVSKASTKDLRALLLDRRYASWRGLILAELEKRKRNP